MDVLFVYHSGNDKVQLSYPDSVFVNPLKQKEQVAFYGFLFFLLYRFKFSRALV